MLVSRVFLIGPREVLLSAVPDQRHDRVVADAVIDQGDLPAGIEGEDPGSRATGKLVARVQTSVAT